MKKTKTKTKTTKSKTKNKKGVQDIKKLNVKQAEKLFNAILDKNKGESVADISGAYLYKDTRIQISEYGAPTSKRVMNLYHKRRALGLCVQCGKKVKTKNPRTKKLYRLCKEHRKAIDRK